MEICFCVEGNPKQNFEYWINTSFEAEQMIDRELYNFFFWHAKIWLRIQTSLAQLSIDLPKREALAPTVYEVNSR